MARSAMVLIIGLDGATWEVIDEQVLQQHMPNLGRLVRDGSSGVLNSTHPPVTPAAWTTLITGCNPPRHGVFGFEQYDFAGNCLRLTSAKTRRVETMWEQLGREGLRLASLNVPWTWPVWPINGVMVAGYGCPNTKTQFTWPMQFKDQLLARIPDYSIQHGHYRHVPAKRSNRKVVAEAIEMAAKGFKQHMELARLAVEKFNPDVLFVEFQDLDPLQHVIWPYMSRRQRDRYPWFRDRVFQLLRKLDEHIGELVSMTGGPAELTVVVSDHGLGPARWQINVNAMLTKWGFIEAHGPIGKIAFRLRRSWRKRRHPGRRQTPIDAKKAINWSKTSAFVAHSPVYGALYLNLEGRQPRGRVRRAEYEQTLSELQQRFSQMVNPQTGRPVFERVARPVEIWGSDSNSLTHAVGDLVLIPTEEHEINRAVKPTLAPVTRTEQRSYCGRHVREGIYVFCGKGIHAGARLKAEIADILPTMYAAMGLAVPEGLDGKVLKEIFTQPMTVSHGQPLRAHDERTETTQMTAEEEQQLRKRLADLGYID